MPSRSSTTPSIRCAGPSRKDKMCCAARAISGCAIRPTCRTASSDTRKPPDAPSQDRTCLPDPARLPGPLRPAHPTAAAGFLKKWYFWATHSRLPPIIDAAHTVKRHWDGILRWFDSRIANGLIEGINSLVQAAKAKARGYRSIRNLKAMVYLLAGKLDLQLPAKSFLPTPNSEEPEK